MNSHMLKSLINNTGILGAPVQETVFAEVLCMSWYLSVIHTSRGNETGFANPAIEKG